jgi:hypothetical protein
MENNLKGIIRKAEEDIKQKLLLSLLLLLLLMTLE